MSDEVRVLRRLVITDSNGVVRIEGMSSNRAMNWAGRRRELQREFPTVVWTVEELRSGIDDEWREVPGE